MKTVAFCCGPRKLRRKGLWRLSTISNSTMKKELPLEHQTVDTVKLSRILISFLWAIDQTLTATTSHGCISEKQRNRPNWLSGVSSHDCQYYSNILSLLKQRKSTETRRTFSTQPNLSLLAAATICNTGFPKYVECIYTGCNTLTPVDDFFCLWGVVVELSVENPACFHR